MVDVEGVVVVGAVATRTTMVVVETGGGCGGECSGRYGGRLEVMACDSVISIFCTNSWFCTCRIIHMFNQQHFISFHFISFL